MSNEEEKDQIRPGEEIPRLIDTLEDPDADIREMSRYILADLTHHSFSTKRDWQIWWEENRHQYQDTTRAEPAVDAPQTTLPPTAESEPKTVGCWLPNPSPLYSLFPLLMLKPEYGSNVLLKSICKGELRVDKDRCIQITRTDPRGQSFTIAEWPVKNIRSAQSRDLPKKHMFNLALIRWAQFAIGGGVLLDIVFTLFLLATCSGAPYLGKALLWTSVFAFGMSTVFGFLIGFLSNLVDAVACRFVQFDVYPRDGDVVLFLVTSDKEKDARDLLKQEGVELTKA